MKPKNSMVIYAAEAGSKALDGLFTPILASSLQQKGRSINQIMMSVRSEVYAKSSGQQTPGEYNQLFEELFLGESAGIDLAPETVFAAKPAPTSYATPTPASGVKDDMVLVEGGTLPNAPAWSELAGKSVRSFYIGRTEVTWLEWKNVRNWAADNSYDIGNVGEGSGNNHPVQNVSWYDCVKWCNARSEMAGLAPVYQVNGKVYRSGEYGQSGSCLVTQNTNANGYRLPRESESVWAARGGVKSRGYNYSGSNDVNAVAWYYDNSRGGAKAVRTKGANELGIYDMSGNVDEWFWDSRLDNHPDEKDLVRIESDGRLVEENRIFRCLGGGSWYSFALGCGFLSKAAFYDPGDRKPQYGFRLARNL
jgi:formylglycine-generating enzyme required for sulfatase activity